MGPRLFLRSAQAQKKKDAVGSKSNQLQEGGGKKNQPCKLFGSLEVTLNIGNVEILTLHLNIAVKVYFLPWMQRETLAQRHEIRQRSQCRAPSACCREAHDISSKTLGPGLCPAPSKAWCISCGWQEAARQPEPLRLSVFSARARTELLSGRGAIAGWRHDSPADRAGPLPSWALLSRGQVRAAVLNATKSCHLTLGVLDLICC